MQPTSRDVHVDVALTQVSVKYNNAELIGEKICPEVKVKKDSDKYFTYGKQDFRIYNTDRAPGTRANKFEWSIDSTNTYAVTEQALEAAIVDEVRDNADDPIRYDADSVEQVTNALMLKQEQTIATAVQLSTNFGKSADVNSAWDDYTSSDPIVDIDNAKEYVRSQIAMDPNTLVITEKQFKALRKHPKLLNLYKYTKGGVLGVDLMKDAFEVQNIYIGKSLYNSAAEGQTDSLTSVWDNTKAALLYVPPNPGLKMLSWAYLFRKEGFRKVFRWREDWVESDFIRVKDKYVLKVIATGAGYQMTKVLSS